MLVLVLRLRLGEEVKAAEGSGLSYSHTRQGRLGLMLGGAGGGSVLVATPDSIHSTCTEL